MTIRSGLKTVLEKAEERMFQSEEEKVLFLDGLLLMHQELEGCIEPGMFADYDYMVTTHDDRTLCFGGYHGVVDGMCDVSPMPIVENFVQNIVMTRGVLRIPRGVEPLERFNGRLLNYVMDLDCRGRVRSMPVKVDAGGKGIDEAVKDAVEELEYQSLSNGAVFLQALENAYRNVLEPRIRRLTGDYDPSHIKYRIFFGTGNGSR